MGWFSLKYNLLNTGRFPQWHFVAQMPLHLQTGESISPAKFLYRQVSQLQNQV